MDFGEILGEILFYLLSILAIVYIFYLIKSIMSPVKIF